MIQKVPPHNIEAETALLGGMLGNPSIIPNVKETLNPSDFFREANAHICSGIFQVGTDLVAIQEYLKKNGLTEKAGGMEYLASLVDAVSTSAAWKYHVDLIKKHSNRRKLIEIATEAQEMAFKDQYEPEETISKIRAGLREIETERGNGYRKMDVVVSAMFKDLEHKTKSENHHIGVLSGFDNIDSHVGGFEPKSLIYLIGRPGMGKTALALSISGNMGQTDPGWTLFFSLEMADSQLVRSDLPPIVIPTFKLVFARFARLTLFS